MLRNRHDVAFVKVDGEPVFIKVDGRPTHPEDEGLPGVYLVAVPEKTTPEDQASIALDCFHEHMAIKVLDDFEIRAIGEDGRELPEKEDAAPYTQGHRGEFLGRCPEEMLPRPFPGLTDHDLGTILAALRMWQAAENRQQQEAFMDIATDGGRFEPLDDDQIDGLCARLNRGRAEPERPEPDEGPTL